MAPLPSNPDAAPTLMALRIHACAPGPAPSACAVLVSVVRGTVKTTKTRAVAIEATASVAPLGAGIALLPERSACSSASVVSITATTLVASSLFFVILRAQQRLDRAAFVHRAV